MQIPKSCSYFLCNVFEFIMHNTHQYLLLSDGLQVKKAKIKKGGFQIMSPPHPENGGRVSGSLLRTELELQIKYRKTTLNKQLKTSWREP